MVGGLTNFIKAKIFEMRFTFPKLCVSIYEKWKKELKQ